MLKKIVLFPFKLLGCLSGVLLIAYVIAVIYVFAVDERFQWFQTSADVQETAKWNEIIEN